MRNAQSFDSDDFKQKAMKAIESTFPKTQVQLCVVHQIRYLMRLIPDKPCKELLNSCSLKTIYQAPKIY